LLRITCAMSDSRMIGLRTSLPTVGGNGCVVYGRSAKGNHEPPSNAA